MSQTSQQPLDGATVGIYIAQRGSEEPEFTEPKQAVADAGATVEVLSSDTDDAETVNNDLDEGDTYEVDRTFEDADSGEFDALIVPGGTVGADRLRTEAAAVDMLRQHCSQEKPTGVICHGPWTLVEADVVDGRTLTSYPSLQTDVRNAGGEWVDEEIVVDGSLVTSRKPDDLDAFTGALVEEIATVAQ